MDRRTRHRTGFGLEGRVPYTSPIPRVDKGELVMARPFMPEGIDKPPMLVLTGHSLAGKSDLYDELQLEAPKQGLHVQGLKNYKGVGREPRRLEFPGIDYIPLGSDAEFESAVQNGTIAVPYMHNRTNYGISREFLDILANGRVPLMIVDAHGVVELQNFLRSRQMPNHLLSFMLHTPKGDANQRLIDRIRREYPPEELQKLDDHTRELYDEIERYRKHQEIARHTLTNPGSEPEAAAERIGYLGRRVMDIINLEARLRTATAEDFREAYVGNVVQKLFHVSSGSYLLGNVGQGLILDIPDQIIQKYAADYHLDAGDVGRAVQRNVIGAFLYYGVLSVFFEGTAKPEHKKWLVDLIERTTGLTPQYKQPEVQPLRESRFSLAQLNPEDPNLMDFAISFSPYDPARAPRSDARIHTLAIESIVPVQEKDRVDMITGVVPKPQVEPLSLDKVVRIIEGNGGNH